MKKTKLLTIVLVVAVMLIGAGYAYWTQDLTITNTVSTGDLKLEFVPLEILDDHGDYDNEFPFSQNYMNVDLNLSPEKLSCSFQDIYPGAGGFIRFRIANTGTVPAKVTGLNSTTIGSTTNDQLDKFDYIVRSLRIYTPKEGTKIVGIDWSKWWSPKFIYENYVYTEISTPLNELTWIYAETFEEFKAQLLDRLDDYILEPYSFFEINGEGAGYDIILPEHITDADGMENLDDLGFNLNITFTQGE